MLDWNEYLEINSKYTGEEIKRKCILFVFLWIQYNHFYNKKYTSDIDKKYKDERERAKAINTTAIHNKYNRKKETYIRQFEKLSTDDFTRNSIKNVKYNNDVLFNKNHSELSDLLNAIYQIRCNLFHGDKLSRDPDAKIIAWAYDCLSELLLDTVL